MSRNQWTRRDMLKASTALALPALVPAHVLGLDGSAPPSETVRVGVIGCGGRSRLIREGADVKGFRVVAACDCEIAKAQRYVQELSGGEKWGVYEDFRQMIDDEKLDAVMVETTTHARGWITIQAMQAGMDVYIEKPMCLTIGEGRSDGQGGAETQSRHASRHAAAFDADQQLGQRSGQERRHRQDHHGPGAQFRQPVPLDEDLVGRRESSGRKMVGHLDEPSRIAAVQPGNPPRLGAVVGL